MIARTELKTDPPSLTYGRLLLQASSRLLSFTDPVRVISTHNPQEVAACLQEIDEIVAESRLYAAGFMTYEAAAAYNLAVHQPGTGALPLLWFGLYDQPQELAAMPAESGSYQLKNWQASLGEEAYTEAIEEIKRYIAAGDTYQVNFTMHLRAQFSGDPYALYADLAQAQQAAHTAYLDLGQYVICSASPELFFQLDGDCLTARPMKGTEVRGRTLAEDEEQIVMLHNSTKDQAENVMIVDMIRNDFGRIAEIGTVEVQDLFTVEKYPTLLQMTSTVTARSQVSLPELMAAVYPCASITGAPKVRTMEIIKKLEPEPRGVYTGAIGYWGPDRQASFNVAIRTVVIDRLNGRADYGVGGGIIWDSQTASEYDECRLKSQVLVERFPSFELLESLLWSPDEEYFLLDNHLERLSNSARYFNFTFDEAEIRQQLSNAAQGLSASKKVRLLLEKNGDISIQVLPIQPASASPVPVCLAETAVDSREVWLYHKTSRRHVYEEALDASPDGYDVILWNERGEITEASSSNLIVELDGQLFTPPVSSGLLAGTYRRFLLEQGRIQEKIITIGDLKRSKRIALINSVRKWREAVL